MKKLKMDVLFLFHLLLLLLLFYYYYGLLCKNGFKVMDDVDAQRGNDFISTIRDGCGTFFIILI